MNYSYSKANRDLKWKRRYGDWRYSARRLSASADRPRRILGQSLFRFASRKKGKNRLERSPAPKRSPIALVISREKMDRRANGEPNIRMRAEVRPVSAQTGPGRDFGPSRSDFEISAHKFRPTTQYCAAHSSAFCESWEIPSTVCTLLFRVLGRNFRPRPKIRPRPEKVGPVLGRAEPTLK